MCDRSDGRSIAGVPSSQPARPDAVMLGPRPTRLPAAWFRGTEPKEAAVPDRILVEEIHLTLTVAATTPDAAREAARRVINGRAFRAALRRAARQVVRAIPALRPVHLT